jgi:hypothetical protein
MRSAKDAVYVEFIDCFNVAVDLCERQFLTQLVAWPAFARIPVFDPKHRVAQVGPDDGAWSHRLTVALV